MKIRSLILTAATLLLLGLTSNASITGMDYADDGDGGIVCPPWTWPGGDTMSIYGDQHFGPAHVWGDVFASDVLDPTLTIGNGIDNDTDFAWTDYHVNIYMGQIFSIVVGSANVSSPGGWSAYITQQPQWDGSEYVGKIDFYAGTPVQIGDEFDFGYAIKFTGSTQYRFCQELIPTPEPGTLSLLLSGAILLGGRTLAKRRQR